MSRITLLPLISAMGLSLLGCTDDKGEEDEGPGEVEDTGLAEDYDQDGYPADEDCNDSDGTINPGATEVCDNIDNDCDGDVDEDVTTTYYRDADGDGFGDLDTYEDSCSAPTGYVPNGNDCDDADADAYPGNSEVCDYIDNDCDGDVDEDVTTTYYADTDGDEWGDASVTDDACSQPTGYAEVAGDCDDTSADVNPDALEYCDLIDNDCDGSTDEDDAEDVSTWYLDSDGDTYGDAAITDIDCYQPSGYVAEDTDCDDADPDTYPGADEYCDGHDDNCDGDIDEDAAVDVITWYQDYDGDTYGDASSTDIDCSQPSGYVADDTDCDDGDDAQYPGADEYCNSEDDDCDGDIDEDGEVVDGDTYYADSDTDGVGDASTTIEACSAPSGYVDNAWDCDDNDGSEPVVVDGSGGSSTGTGTLSDPYDSIQDGIDDASSCAIVMSGTYKEAIDFDGKSIELWGIEGAEYTTIDADGTPCDAASPTGCESAVTAASGSSASPSLIGFTITGGTGTITSSSDSESCADSSASYDGVNTCTVNTYEYWGGGVLVDGDDLTLTDCIIEDNTLPEFEQTAVDDFEQNWLYSYGGGVAVLDGTLDLEGVEIYDNFADSGGAIYAESGASLTLAHTFVSGNAAEDGGGAYLTDGGDLSASNSIFSCNEAETDGGGLFATGTGSSVDLTNVVLAMDSSSTGSTHGAAFYGDSSASLTMWNSIVFTDIGAYAVYGSGSGSFDYNDVYNSDTASYTYGGGFSAGSSDIAQNPDFGSVSCDGNASNDDYTLGSSSPAIDAGDPSSAYNDTDGTTNDQGAYGGPNGEWD